MAPKKNKSRLGLSHEPNGKEVSLSGSMSGKDLHAEVEVSHQTSQDVQAEVNQLVGRLRQAMLSDLGAFESRLNAVLTQSSSKAPNARPQVPINAFESTRSSVEPEFSSYKQHSCDQIVTSPSGWSNDFRKNDLVFGRKEQLYDKIMHPIVDTSDLTSPLHKKGFLFDVHGFLEIGIAGIICLNTVSIGLSTEFGEDYSFFNWLDLFFTCVFVLEKALAFYLYGWKEYCPCKIGNFASYFDVFLIFIDIVHFITFLIVPETNGGGYTVLRIFRLLRLTRILKLFLGQVAVETFFRILDGLKDGLPAIAWSFAFLGGVIYMIAIVCKRTLESTPVLSHMFSTVFRSTITIFRCIFGECTTAEGYPIYELIEQSHGRISAIFYIMCVFTVMVGIFNVINATFVDTMGGATKVREQAALHQRLQNAELFAAGSLLIIGRMVSMFADEWMICSFNVEFETKTDVPKLFKNHRLRDQKAANIKRELEATFKDICAIPPLTNQQLSKLVKDPLVSAVLMELDIHPADHYYLHDMFDPENNGLVPIENLIDGMQRLRGRATRGDVITVDLMVRDIQQNIRSIQEVLRSVP